jgi:hypothetical protein
MCAEPVRNVRSDGAGFARSVWLRWVIGGVVVAVLSVWVCGGVGMWLLTTVVKNAQKEMEQAQADEEADRRARTVVVAAAQLLQEFQDGADAADRKYQDKYLEISGVVERGGTSRDGIPFVVLHAGDENAKIKIECFFDSADDEDEAWIKQLRKGQIITLRGEYSGRVSHVQIRECVLVK